MSVTMFTIHGVGDDGQDPQDVHRDRLVYMGPTDDGRPAS